MFCPKFHKSVILKLVLCAILLNTLLKSKSIKSNCFHICMFLQISSCSITNCVPQNLFSMNPCCSSNSMLQLVKCLVKYDVTMCSSILHGTPVRDIGDILQGLTCHRFKNGGYARKLPGVKILLLWIFHVFLCLVFAMLLYASVYTCPVVTCWESADFLALICGVLLWVCYFPIGILGQVWYLILSIPDLCTLTYFS